VPTKPSIITYKAQMKSILFPAICIFSTSLATAAIDPDLPAYVKAEGLSGNLSSIGSDTLNNLVSFWAEEFKRNYPSVNIQVQGAGSSTAPPALTEGTASLGPMSREMKSQELEAFEQRHGYKPTAIRVAIDALAVYVHRDNPIRGLSVPQIDAIFSSTRKCGYEEDITRWSQLGITGSLAGKSLQLYGRNSVSGTYGYFKEHALCKGDFKANVNEQPGSASVVQSVSASLNAMGYSGIGYKTSGIRALALGKKADGPMVEPTEENAIKGTYPLARFLYIYVNKHPNKPLDRLDAEFLKMVLSRAGQQIVVKDGYIPLPGKIVLAELAKLGQ
jgi:phosphate transport system substrate-binding protein